MVPGPLSLAHRLLVEAVDALSDAAGPCAADAELISLLTLCEGTTRRLDRLAVGAVADLERRGTFAERGYRSTVTALGDLLGWERLDAKRRIVVAEQVRPRTGLDGAPLPARLPCTAEVFDAGEASLRHVEVVARVLGSDAARRLSPAVWSGAEAQLATWIVDCTPAELQTRGTQLVDALDADGPEPDDRPPVAVDELYLHRHAEGRGGRLVGRFDDAACSPRSPPWSIPRRRRPRPTTGAAPRSARPRRWPTRVAMCSTTVPRRSCPSAAGDART